jgi:hypothetical protein
VWIYTQNNITNMIFTWVHNTNTEKIHIIILRTAQMGSDVRTAHFV